MQIGHNILSLFSGTNSWTQFYSDDFKVHSVDIEYRYRPYLVRDISKWDFKEDIERGFLPSNIDIIYASPPCNLYFTLLKNPPGSNPKRPYIEYTEADRNLSILLVNKTIEIINYFNPRFFVIENPVGRIKKHFPSILNQDPVRVDYCQYGFEYMKPTYIYTNVKFTPKRCNHIRHEVGIKGYGKEGILRETYKAMIAPGLSKEICDRIVADLQILKQS